MRLSHEPSHPEFGRAVECTACTLVKDRRLRRIFNQAGIPPHFADATFDSYPAAALTQFTAQQVRLWAEADPCLEEVALSRTSLLLWGDWGVGKTGLAVAAMRRRVEITGCEALFITTPTLLDRIRATYTPSPEAGSEAEVLEAVKNATLLVLDDLGAERATDWVAEKLFTIINHRHDYQLATIFTSNLSPEQLARHLGERTAWRICEMSAILHLEGPNLRRRGI